MDYWTGRWEVRARGARTRVSQGPKPDMKQPQGEDKQLTKGCKITTKTLKRPQRDIKQLKKDCTQPQPHKTIKKRCKITTNSPNRTTKRSKLPPRDVKWLKKDTKHPQRDLKELKGAAKWAQRHKMAPKRHKMSKKRCKITHKKTQNDHKD